MIDPIGAASFPCGEIPRHRKKATKQAPAKAKHKHDYEPVILVYTNPCSVLTERGFLPGTDYYPGRACRYCGKIVRGFADGVSVITTRLDGTTIVLKPEYQHLR